MPKAKKGFPRNPFFAPLGCCGNLGQKLGSFHGISSNGRFQGRRTSSSERPLVLFGVKVWFRPVTSFDHDRICCCGQIGVNAPFNCGETDLVSLALTGAVAPSVSAWAARSPRMFPCSGASGADAADFAVCMAAASRLTI